MTMEWFKCEICEGDSEKVRLAKYLKKSLLEYEGWKHYKYSDKFYAFILIDFFVKKFYGEDVVDQRKKIEPGYLLPEEGGMITSYDGVEKGFYDKTGKLIYGVIG